MKKIILLITIIFITGCQVEYNINLEDNINERTSFINENVETFEPWFYNVYKNDVVSSEENIKIEGIEYYNIENIPNRLTYSFSFPKDKYEESNALSYCYEVVNVDINDNFTEISTSNRFDCFRIHGDLESVKINVTGKYILESNAPIQNESVHSWELTENNQYDSYIYIKYQTEEQFLNPVPDDDDNQNEGSEPGENTNNDNNNEDEQIVKSDDSIGLIILATFGSLMLLFAIVILIKKNNS